MQTFAKVVIGAMLVACAGIGLVAAADGIPAVLNKAINEKLPAINFTPAFDAQSFTDHVDNPYFPLKPGTTFIYTGIKGGAQARETFQVTDDHKTILGVATTVVHDTLYAGGKVVEETTDWYAQDKQGNVWYFGEATKALDKGKWTTEGSWQAGVDGARPGVYAQATPKVGDSYMQEFFNHRAGDSAKVLALNEPITVPYGSYKNAQLTMEWTSDEPGAFDAKYYVSGVGVVKEFAVTGAMEKLSLEKIERLSERD